MSNSKPTNNSYKLTWKKIFYIQNSSWHSRQWTRVTHLATIPSASLFALCPTRCEIHVSFSKGKNFGRYSLFSEIFSEKDKALCRSCAVPPRSRHCQAFGQRCEQCQRFSIYVLRNGYASIQKFYRVLQVRHISFERNWLYRCF